ncbi:TetR/AcrR family transcriptional regulator [Actinokineospora sp. NBRC 105648]|uniref:TetR/AcrR family transcriptional regulator n=1 Tax=Actinokineospora sp. NBRC 105648 TaxID=3032206 RepID=UPI0024A1668C|nr:TetR/AcrR family transcriptional regulator [Actinokineospora sp. NBRC 105648]GLZ41599.1 TetR family transcriptional regulator [Actinokineospora sp. NBRC 105648]
MLDAMVTRAESAAATRRALLDAAAELLDLGGPEAVTVREVGARAGVTRGAPYRHFADKDSLLTAIAAETWDRIANQVHALRTNPALPTADTLRSALRLLIGVGRDQPHLYQLLFKRPVRAQGLNQVHRQLCGPPADPAAAVHAAERFQDEFLAVVAALAGERNARQYGALLLTSAHGIAGMELSGHLDTDKWHTTPDELVDTLVRMITPAGQPT